MNLPFILDIVLGLIFIYLILSLLASELQELLTTLLQWRAAHLKKSIEILLAGGASRDPVSSDSESAINPNINSIAEVDQTTVKAKRILEDIYANPLIENISQEARGGLEEWLRQIFRSIVTLGRDRRRLTLKGNEPSYIPAETFATTLLDRLKLSELTHDLTVLKLQVFVERDILASLNTQVNSYLNNDENTQLSSEIQSSLRRKLDNLREIYRGIIDAFRSRKISLQTSVYRLRSELNSYILSTTALIQPSSLASPDTTSDESTSPSSQIADNPLLWQLGSIQRGIFYDDQNANYNNIDEVIKRLQPSLDEVLEVFRKDIDRTRERYSEFESIYQSIRRKAQDIADDLPLPVQESLAALARRAEINLQRSKDQIELIQDELKQFKLEIQTWFDRSMDRASGVYKRNAKGVGFLIGFILAIAINADTLHIVSRLTTDSTLRDALVSSAQVISSRCNLPNQLRQSTPSPVPPAPSAAPAPPPEPAPPPAEQPAVHLPGTRWPLLEQPAFAQAAPAPAPDTEESPIDCITDAVEQETTLPLGWSQENLAQQEEDASQSTVPLPTPLRRLLGWMITGLAIAMGASFWFDLLGKVINVRNSGRRPETTVDTTLPNRNTDR